MDGIALKPLTVSFVERILSVVITCRQQHRNLFAFLTEAVQSRLGEPADPAARHVLKYP
jgi:hypothetical protein